MKGIGQLNIAAQFNSDFAANWEAIIGDNLNVFALAVQADFDHIVPDFLVEGIFTVTRGLPGPGIQKKQARLDSVESPLEEGLTIAYRGPRISSLAISAFEILSSFIHRYGLAPGESSHRTSSRFAGHRPGL